MSITVTVLVFFRNPPSHCDALAEFHVLGDSAYPLSANMLVPDKDIGHLDPGQMKFNKVYYSTRVNIERAIDLLKSKF